MYHRAGKQIWYYLEVYLKSHNIISLESVKLALSSTHSITVLKYAVNPRVHCEDARDFTKMLNLMRKRARTEQGVIARTAAITTTAAAAATTTTDVAKLVQATRQRTGRPTNLRKIRKYFSLHRMTQIGSGERRASYWIFNWGKGEVLSR